LGCCSPLAGYKKENSMSSSNLIGLLNKYPDAGGGWAIGHVSGAASGRTASVSASVSNSADGQGAISAIHAIAQATADDAQVTTTGDAIATGGTAFTLVSLAAGVDLDAGIVAVSEVTAKADADTAEGSFATTATLATIKAQADDIDVTSSGNADASGESVSTSVMMAASVDQQPKVMVVDLARAEAVATEGGTASAKADTDAMATGNDLVVSKEHETTMTDSSHPIVLSVTYLQGVLAASAQAAPLEALVSEVDVATLQTDVSSFNAEL
jgi:hypothetical protein